VNCTKTAEPIEMPFGLWIWIGRRNRVKLIRWWSKSLMGSGQFWGKRVPIVKYIDFLPWAVQKRQDRSRFGLVMDSSGPKETCIRGVPDPPCEGQLLRERTCPGGPKEAHVQSYSPGVVIVPS